MILQEGHSAEQGNFSANAPIPNQNSAGNRGGFSGFTTSNFNQASARSQSTASQISPEIQENPIAPITDLLYSAAEI
jgi:hypothetical protein